jgi:hypothetical protein
MIALTKEELSTLYSIAVRQVQGFREEEDDYAYKKFVDYWDKLADKLRVLHEEETGEIR